MGLETKETSLQWPEVSPPKTTNHAIMLASSSEHPNRDRRRDDAPPLVARREAEGTRASGRTFDSSVRLPDVLERGSQSSAHVVHCSTDASRLFVSV